jgi:hypothetical protein
MLRQNTAHKATQTIKGTLQTMNTTQEKGNAIPITGLGIWEYGRGDPLRWPRNTLYPQKLALTSPRRSLGRYSSLADYGYGDYFLCSIPVTGRYPCNRPIPLCTKPEYTDLGTRPNSLYNLTLRLMFII